MAHIEPFRALRYDPAQVRLEDVVTQPYDKITPEMQERYYSASPYNLVRIILGKRFANDDATNNPYSRAAISFAEWRKKGIFLQDSRPAIYRYAQQFRAPGQEQTRERQGFVALGKIEDYADGVVFRHEQTLAKPKADRLDLLRATRAHFGQIFMLYSDPGGEVETSITSPQAPDIEVADEYGVVHRLWMVSDPTVIDFVRTKMREKRLIIADGHHRYETALNYRNERRADPGTSTSGSRLAPHDLVMMTFVNLDSPGLLILPTHRVVHGSKTFSADEFRRKASEFFSVEEADGRINAKRAAIMLKEAAQTGTALLAVTKDRAFLLSRAKAPAEIFGGASLGQQALDVVQLHRCILERTLGISEEAIRNQENIRYIRDAGEAIELVHQGSGEVAFLMNPVPIKHMRDVAFAGEVMPQKSTDFYPKLLSGLTIYALE
jgi:uncharacterized protein (DUF1015 family)